ncbi:hypothetical protein PBAL39_20069 [Pedobacter sp. BAL39]|nr:hypothetical protein PBAL39_20069 [Pedobacter sp. BAL39]
MVLILSTPDRYYFHANKIRYTDHSTARRKDLKKGVIK